MDNASLFHDGLTNHAAVANLLGKQEDIFLDFKESRTKTGALLDDDKLHYRKAASGFAHQEGGVLVWGIEARKGANDINEAIALKPIPNLKRFLTELNDYVKYSTEPVVDGIRSRVVFENDDEPSNRGFAVTLFPKSSSEHKALGGTTSDFYKRYGDSFVPLSTADIRSLFFRTFSPDLELRAKGDPNGWLEYSLFNRGRGIAKFASANIGLSITGSGGIWFDGEGKTSFKNGSFMYIRQDPYSIQFNASANVVVHPGQEIPILQGPTFAGVYQQRYISKVVYRLFAENMLPREGTLEFSGAHGWREAP
ncbi:MAG TPA: ATP-binding protein [Terriglobia bacterium]|nr:ATP-binding protein [Terriglobia bacterium]